MELARGITLANEIIAELKPYCRPLRIEVVGSIRRKKPDVNDIDIVLVPADPWNLFPAIEKLGPYHVNENGQISHGAKIRRIDYKLAQIDFYIATEEIWATLLLIRTGSKENNIRLCTHAKNKGWHLAANGDGLFDQSGKRIAGDTEESIYKALGLPYQAPEKR